MELNDTWEILARFIAEKCQDHPTKSAPMLALEIFTEHEVDTSLTLTLAIIPILTLTPGTLVVVNKRRLLPSSPALPSCALWRCQTY